MGSMAIEKLLLALVEMGLEHGVHTFHTGLAGSVK